MAKIAQMAGLVGDKELQKTILSLTDNVAKKLMRPAVAAGLKPIREQAKDNAAPGSVLSSEASGLMQKAIKSSTRAKKNKVSGKVYVDRKTEGEVNGKKHVPGNVAHLVEFGHGGPMPASAHPFLRPALDNKKGEAMNKITDKARELLPKVVQDARAKGKAVYLLEGE